MAKAKIAFVCSQCGAQHSKWQGQCSSCKAWNTLGEEILEPKPQSKPWSETKSDPFQSKAQILSEISPEKENRISSENKELDRVLGGGITLGSVTLIGGEPGIGKSTLLLQVALSLQNSKVLYVSGEESLRQIKLRAERVGLENSQCYILCQTQIEKIFEQAKQIKPDLLIIDSIQTIEQRIKEAEKLGYKTIFISAYNKLEAIPRKINIKPLHKIEDLYTLLFEKN
ncbi:MAG: hypothetical protein C4K58_00105 [Flavobacteriaceae bacterium]|nr:MAG: hypothetical protein C4K58_00105 [Flavobacteriaceae bacterium]